MINLKFKGENVVLTEGKNDCHVILSLCALHKIPEKNGTIVNSKGKPRVGIWLMPDNDVDGMLEDFCRQLVDDQALKFASNCVQQAKDKQITSFIDNHHSKAVVHTFLAWQNEPGMPIGQAITAKALDGNKPLANKQFSVVLILLKIKNHGNNNKTCARK